MKTKMKNVSDSMFGNKLGIFFAHIFFRILPRGVVTMLVLVTLFNGNWILKSAIAAPPLMELKFTEIPTKQLGITTVQTGSTVSQTITRTIQSGQPLTGINLSLINSGLASPNSRLRIFIHDSVDRDLLTDDIKIDVTEGGKWVPVPLELIDGGLFGALGAEGSGHKEPYQSGGFIIPAKVNKLWQLRLMFNLPGVYTFVVAISPDNGDTHLVQPTILTVEVI
jgi:hypothetical protein